MNEKLDKKTIFDSVLQPPLQNGRFLKLWSLGNLAKHRLKPIFDNNKPRDKRSVHLINPARNLMKTTQKQLEDKPIIV